MKILWFSKVQGTSSFSRVTRSMLAYLTHNHDITLLSDQNLSRDDGEKSITKFIKILQNTTSITYENFKNSWKLRKVGAENYLEMNMKYIVTQIIDEIFEGEYDAIMLLNGIYEADWYSEQLINCLNFLKIKCPDLKIPKLIIWTPIDYRPSADLLKFVIKADILLTMTENMADSIKQLTGKETFTLGHGCDIYKQKEEEKCDKKDIYHIVNAISTNPTISETDIIILNANDYVHRKQIKLTIESFIELLKKYNDNNDGIKNRLKIWIHTNLEKMMKDPEGPNKLIFEYRDNIILSNNSLTSIDLHKIYSRCQIGIQTSTGEGFSMTNIEHAYLGGLQVVPNFLATGKHFERGKGILIPVTELEILSENNRQIFIGKMKLNKVTESLKKAVDMVIENGDEYHNMIKLSFDYVNKLTWKSIADKFNQIVENY